MSNHNPKAPAWRARFPDRRRKVHVLNVHDDAYDLICTEAVRSKRTITAVADEVVNRMLDAEGAA